MEYPLCDRTVTRYRKTPEGIERTLLEGCYYEWLLGSRQDVAGVRNDRRFLLVIPAGRGEVQVGDRVIEGIGPKEVDWNRSVPAAVEGLGQVAYVRPYYLNGRLCHTEAGRK